MLPSSTIVPTTNVASGSIKARRTSKRVDPDDTYPASVVSDHVPFYIASKSPMLYKVQKGHPEYGGGPGPLVFLGCVLGDIIDSDLTWCASDGNAAAEFTRFSREVAALGDFVDFEVLRARDWRATLDDPDRRRRRSAEILVLSRIPLELVSLVVCYQQQTLDRVMPILERANDQREYRVMPEMYF